MAVEAMEFHESTAVLRELLQLAGESAISNAPRYGVFMWDRGEWCQISEHRQISIAATRAYEAHELMGTRVRIHSNDGTVHLEIRERRGQRANPAANP